MKNKILSKLPMYNGESGRVDRKAMVGNVIRILYNEKEYDVLIKEYIPGDYSDSKNPIMPRFITECNGKIHNIMCQSFMNCQFGQVVDYKKDFNKIRESEDGLHWIGTTSDGTDFMFDCDDDTLNYIKGIHWSNANGYIINRNKRLSLHKVIFGDVGDLNKIIHINKNRLDNRRNNLKKVPRATVGKEFNIDKNGKIYNYDMILSEDNTYYTVIDKKGNTFKIDNNDRILEIIKHSNWCVTKTKGSNNIYVKSGNGHSLHRVLFDIVSKKYQNWHVDHINGDGTDNRMCNLVITDHYGNMCNKKGKGYLQIKNGSFLVQYMYEYPDNRMFRGRATRPTFKNEQDAIEEVNWRREYIMKNRLKFNSKRELDEYIANNKTK